MTTKIKYDLKIRLLFLTIFMSLNFQGCSTISQEQKLNLALGHLALEYTQTYSYQNNYRGVHMARTSGMFYEIYESEIKSLDKQYRAEYFLSAFWIIPFEGGEIGILTQTIAQDSSNRIFLKELEDFIKAEEERSYQPDKYQFAILIRDEVKSIINEDY